MSQQFTLFQLPENHHNNDKEEIYKGKPRINIPSRIQSEMRIFSIDNLIPKDHKVRLIWDYVLKLDMSKFLNEIQSTEGNVGRPATDPHLLLALWLYATIEGIGSGRVIDRYCREHNAFQWLCGDVEVNYHTLNDFRSNNEKALEELIIQSVAILVNKGTVKLERISQDGIRVRANAGSSSFRRKDSLKDCLKEAREHVNELKKLKDENPSEFLKRNRIAELKAAQQREKNIEEALQQLEKLKKSKEESKKKQRKKFTEEEKKELRVSTTDPEARKMKMANGGFSPAYNIQIATDTKTQVIVGLSATNSGTDISQLSAMYKKVSTQFNKMPNEWLADAGYCDQKEINNIAKMNPNCKIYMPSKNPDSQESYTPRPGDTEAVKEWKICMGTIKAKTIYKDRASTSECVNANARNRGLQQFVVRGLKKVMSCMCIFVLTHNMIRMMNF